MFSPLVRRSLTQSPRYLRSLSALPLPSALPSATRLSVPRLQRFSSTESDSSNEATNPSAEGPIFSPGSDVAKVSAEYKLLYENHSWELSNNRMGIHKTYLFRSYTRCMDFALSVALHSKYQNHHPTIVIKFSNVKVVWATHSPPGLSEKDIDMAKFCDEQATKLKAFHRNP